MKKMIMNLLKKSIVPLIIIIIGIIYWIRHLYPFKTETVEGGILDILFVFCILIGVSFLIAYLYDKKTLPILKLSLFIISVIAVMMVYFYKLESQWDLDDRLSFIEVSIGITSAIMVICGGYLALKQMNEAVQTNKLTAQTNKLSAYSKMIEILQKEEGRNNRKIIFNLFDEKTNYIRPWKQWSDEEMKAAHDILADIDQIGLMVKYGLLDYEFLEGWTYSIYKCLYILEEYKKIEEFQYYYRMPTTDKEKKLSNYFLGVNELKKLRNKDIVFDYEEKGSVSREKISELWY